MVETHILIVTFPGQGHINPSLQLAKRLTKLGIKITLLTTLSAINRMTTISTDHHNSLIQYTSFSDGFNGKPSLDTFQEFMSSIAKQGSTALTDMIKEKREQGKPFSCIIYSLLVPWAGDVAHNLKTPSTLLWIQAATLFDLHFYHFNGYVFPEGNEVIELPGLPKLETSDLPSDISGPTNNHSGLLILQSNFEILDRETITPTVLVNTFDALEEEPLRIIEKYKLIAIGPLIPSALLDTKDSSDCSYGGDLIEKSVEYVQWLDSQEESSVAYLAFGSYSDMPKSQLEEVAKGLIKACKPFLWVIRGTEDSTKLDEMLSCREELENLGKIVPWCVQVEVLSHPSVGCFVTHCGWNSSLESLASGVPVVAMPQWLDQTTDAKLLQDYWETGVRARKGDDGVVESDEIRKCLNIVMESEEIREKAKKWKELAKESMEENGSSNLNLKMFVENVGGGYVERSG